MISSPSLRQQRAVPLAARRERDTPDIAGRCVHRDTGLPLPRAERRTIRHGRTGQSRPALSNRLATRPAVCRNGRPNRTCRVRQTWIALSGKGPGWEGLRMATLAARPGAPAHAGIKPDRARPPASWRCVTGRPVGRTRAGGRWQRQAHQPTDRIRKDEAASPIWATTPRRLKPTGTGQVLLMPNERNNALLTHVDLPQPLPRRAIGTKMKKRVSAGRFRPGLEPDRAAGPLRGRGLAVDHGGRLRV